MTRHPDYPATEMLEERTEANGEKLESEFSTAPLPRPLGRLHYWWSLFCAGALLAVVGPPTIPTLWLIRRREWLYPFARFGAWAWLFLSGMKIVVRGRERLDPRQSYVFIANHRSYLDTATLFYYGCRRMGVIAKKELLKVPILGNGMGFVNIMAIDRTNRESALRTMSAAGRKMRAGVSFGVFAEGTRAPVGTMLPFKKGAFYLAIEAGVPIVPVAIKNTDKLMGKGTGVSRPGTIEMLLLPPIDTANCSTDEEVARLIEHTHGLIAKELGLEGRVKALKRR